ncbi:MAG: cytochrome c oxidase assembly protein [Alphaproteobacteria bacterium]
MTERQETSAPPQAAPQHVSPQDQAEMARKNGRALALVLSAVFGMVGLSFAAVPLYDLFCRVTGLDGTTQVASKPSGEVLEQTIKVRFDANVAGGLPWDFKPEVTEVEIPIGATGHMSYLAANMVNEVTSGMALYNVTPKQAGLYFSKIQCFCFDNQPLEPGQDVKMPVFFYVDPEITRNRHTQDIHTITLSYTFFPSDSESLEQAKEAYYTQMEQLNSQ